MCKIQNINKSDLNILPSNKYVQEYVTQDIFHKCYRYFTQYDKTNQKVEIFLKSIHHILFIFSQNIYRFFDLLKDDFYVKYMLNY